MKHARAALFLLLAAVGPLPGGALAETPAATADQVVATQGDVRLTLGELQAALDRLDPAQRAQLLANPPMLANFARDQVLNRSILAEARAKGWDQRPEVKARAQQAYDATVVQSYVQSVAPLDPAYPSQAEVQAAFDANRSRMMLPRQFHLAQIVVLVPPGASPETVEAARRKAADLRAQAMKPKADFAELARKNSDEHVTAARGGDVGFVREDQLLPGIREAVINLQPGGTTAPLRAPDGWHVVRVLEIRPAGPATLEEVRPQLVAALRQGRAQAVLRSYLEQLTAKEPIQLNEAVLAGAAPGH
jgi:peptidylprolyl isomerase